MSTKPTEVDAYLLTVPDDARAMLEELRHRIKAVAPDAVESISYGIPTFKYRGQRLIYIGAAKNHCAVYGTPKGTIRFALGERLPEALVESLVSARVVAIDSAPAGPKRRKPSKG